MPIWTCRQAYNCRPYLDCIGVRQMSGMSSQCNHSHVSVSLGSSASPSAAGRRWCLPGCRRRKTRRSPSGSTSTGPADICSTRTTGGSIALTCTTAPPARCRSRRATRRSAARRPTPPGEDDAAGRRAWRPVWGAVRTQRQGHASEGCSCQLLPTIAVTSHRQNHSGNGPRSGSRRWSSRMLRTLPSASSTAFSGRQILKLAKPSAI
ncbi:MAG: hypothetical protein JWQ95_458 [Sphaerisporangium sp.]|nr:hypothetical protein [Sphaerisporangium sp.]